MPAQAARGIGIVRHFNLKIINRGIDKNTAIEDMQDHILSSDLKKLHKFKRNQVDIFLKEKNET